MTASPASRDPLLPASGVGLAAILLVAAVALRAAALGNPVVHSDEQYYLAVAHGWSQGALPYVDWWDRKPIGLFLLYRPAAALADPGAAILAYQLGALAAAAATAWLIARIAAAAGWTRGGLPSAVLYLAWLDLADGQGGQSPVFYNAPMALAAWLAMRRRGWRDETAAMALVGVALQIKYSAVFEGAWFYAWLLWRHRSAGWRGQLARAAWLGAVAALPTALAAASYAAIGAGRVWWFANVASVLRRAAAPLGEQLGNAATCLAILAIPVGLAVAGWRRAQGARASGAVVFLRGWLIAALAGLAAFGTWFDHYTLPVLVPAAAGAAAVLGAGRRRWWLLAGAALAGQASIVAARWQRGTPAQFAALAAAVGRGPGCLYVHSGPAMLYPVTDRCPASRFAYPSHLTRTREAPAIGEAPAAEIARLFARAPAVVVMGQPFRGEDLHIRALVERRLARAYRPAAIRPLGRDRLTVYVRR